MKIKIIFIIKDLYTFFFHKYQWWVIKFDIKSSCISNLFITKRILNIKFFLFSIM